MRNVSDSLDTSCNSWREQWESLTCALSLFRLLLLPVTDAFTSHLKPPVMVSVLNKKCCSNNCFRRECATFFGAFFDLSMFQLLGRDDEKNLTGPGNDCFFFVYKKVAPCTACRFHGGHLTQVCHECRFRPLLLLFLALCY